MKILHNKFILEYKNAHVCKNKERTKKNKTHIHKKTKITRFAWLYSIYKKICPRMFSSKTDGFMNYFLLVQGFLWLD